MSDALACSRTFRVLAVVDDFTRECLALAVDNSLSGIRVARELGRMVERRARTCLVVRTMASNSITSRPPSRRRMAAQQFECRRPKLGCASAARVMFGTLTRTGQRWLSKYPNGLTRSTCVVS
jgi:hypothetical protein